MVHIMEVATMNSHEIGQMEAPTGQNWLLGQTVPVGCALEPTLVLLNHACDPTMIRSVLIFKIEGLGTANTSSLGTEESKLKVTFFTSYIISGAQNSCVEMIYFIMNQYSFVTG